MYTKELQYIEGYRMFSDMLENLQKNQSNILGSNISKQQISNKSEKNFLDILDEKIEKMEKMKDVLKGNSYHLEGKKKKEEVKGKKDIAPKKSTQSKIIVF